MRIILGKKIREERRRKNWSLKMLAERTNISANHLGKIERGESMPSSNTLYKICNALQFNAFDSVNRYEKKRIT